jgi:hypothetical protein
LGYAGRLFHRSEVRRLRGELGFLALGEWIAFNLSGSGHLMESRALLSHVLEVRLRTSGDADDETLRVGSQATRVYRRTAWRRVPALVPDRPGVGQGVCLLERSQDRFVDMLRQRPYSVLIFSSLSRLAVMDSSTELVPLIHAPPSCRRD